MREFYQDVPGKKASLDRQQAAKTGARLGWALSGCQIEAAFSGEGDVSIPEAIGLGVLAGVVAFFFLLRLGVVDAVLELLDG